MFRFTIRDVLWLTIAVAIAAGVQHYVGHTGPKKTAGILVGLSVLASAAAFTVTWNPLGKRLNLVAGVFLVIAMAMRMLSNWEAVSSNTY
jgi:hypothetical protein